MDENREHCKHIATELENVVNGYVWICPECGALIRLDGEHETPHYCYTCPECKETTGADEWEQASLWDYLRDVFDVEFRIGSDKAFRSVKIMVACGGPNIYIDTAAGAVLLYWWTDKAEYSLDPDTVEAVNEWAEEWYNC